jgi:signal transduction histidine kinase
MKVRTNLMTKIVLWFFLNLVILAIVLGFFFSQQFKLDAGSMLRMQTGDKFRAITMLFMHEARDNEPENWAPILTQLSEAYEVEFLAYDMEGNQLAGKSRTLPKQVIEKLSDLSKSRENRRSRREGREHHGPPPEGPGFGPPGGGRPGGEGRRGRHLFQVKTAAPKLYWAGVEVPIRRGGEGPPEHVALIAVSDNLTGNGLFFNPKPWFLIIAVVIVFSILLWFPLVRSITGPLRKVTEATGRIAQGRFDVKLDEKRTDEIGQLSHSINDMTTRLDGLLKGQKRFLGDVAHELASPIGKMQLGLGILQQRASEENQERVADVLEEAQHMSTLVNELLSFSRAEINPGKVQLKPTPLREVAERVIGRETRDGADISTDIDPTLTAIADSELLARALSNLVRNAIRYAAQHGPITISAKPLGSKVSIIVQDSGNGVPEEHLAQLFEPFFRPDLSRVRETGGVGLGMAIVKTCVDACGGTVTARNIRPKGFAVTVELEGN